MGMIESVTESLYGLLAEGSGSDSGSDSSRGSYHPSRECFMVGTPKGHVESVSTKETTPAGNLGGEIEGDTAALPRIGVEQLRAQKREIIEARQRLVWEYAEVDQEIKHHRDGGCARTMAHDVNQRIIADDETLPHFARASQNIAATTALFHGLPEAATSEDLRAR